MRNITGPTALIIVLCMAAPATARTLHWDRIDVQVTVNPDSTLTVVERQRYIFDGEWNGGYRDLDLHKVERYSDFEVWEGDLKYKQGSIEHRGGFIVQRLPMGRLRIKWRSREVTDPPYHDQPVTFDVKYTVHGALNYRGEYDELYWKMIFPDRVASVNEATAVVRLPGNFRSGDVKVRLFALADDARAWVDEDGVPRAVAHNLPPGDAMEMLVRFPAGSVQRRVSAVRAWNDVLGLPVMLLSFVVVVLGMLVHFVLHGRDREVGEFAEYIPEPPSDISPAVAGTLMDERAGMREVVAAIVNAARKGYIRIEEKSAGTWLGTTREYEFVQLKPFDSGLSREELRAVTNLKLHGVGDSTRLSELEDEFYTVANSIQEDLYQQVVELGYFDVNPSTTRWAYVAVGFLTALAFTALYIDVSALPVVTGLILRAVTLALGIPLLLRGVRRGESGAGAIISGIIFVLFAAGLNPGTLLHSRALGLPIALGVLSAVVVWCFAPVMPAKTILGSRERARWMAFRRYLENLRLYGDRSRAQEIFEDYLPYAIAFGIERQMVYQFRPLNLQAPAWYTSTHFTDVNFTTVDSSVSSLGQGISSMSLQSISDGLFSMVNSMSSTLSSAPSSSGAEGA
ncbi:MAG: DUF2207 domain-containing protein, partial [Armatimonadetes bacterium]|nr:DUF2207 domain-containing protein [Armatimonadota bacterium]